MASIRHGYMRVRTDKSIDQGNGEFDHFLPVTRSDLVITDETTGESLADRLIKINDDIAAGGGGSSQVTPEQIEAWDSDHKNLTEDRTANVRLLPGTHVVRSDRSAIFRPDNIEGRTLMNRIGYFSNFTSKADLWYKPGAEIAINNTSSITLTGTGQNEETYLLTYNTGFSVPAVDSKVFVRMTGKVDSPNCTQLKICLYDATIGAEYRAGTVTNPQPGETYDFGGVITITQEMVDNWVQYVGVMTTATYATKADATGATYHISKMALYDINETDAQLPIEELLIKYPYSNGMEALDSPYVIAHGSNMSPSDPDVLSMLAFQTKIYSNPMDGSDPDIIFEKDGHYLKRSLWQEDIIHGDIPGAVYEISATGVGYKRIRIKFSLSTTPHPDSLGGGDDPNRKLFGTGFSGMPLSRSSLSVPNTIAVGSDTSGVHGNYVLIIASNNESGWGDDYTPSSDEIRAYLNGWKMFINGQDRDSIYNKVGTPAWVEREADGTVSEIPSAYTINLPTIKAPRSKLYTFLYRKETESVTVVNTEGILKLHEGDNTIIAGSNIILHEAVKPPLNPNTPRREINFTEVPTSRLKFDVDTIIGIYRNHIIDPQWSIGNGTINSPVANSYGLSRANLRPENFDEGVAYTIIYTKLNKTFSLPLTGKVAANEKTQLSDIVNSVAQLDAKSTRLAYDVGVQSIIYTDEAEARSTKYTDDAENRSIAYIDEKMEIVSYSNLLRNSTGLLGTQGWTMATGVPAPTTPVYFEKRPAYFALTAWNAVAPNWSRAYSDEFPLAGDGRAYTLSADFFTNTLTKGALTIDITNSAQTKAYVALQADLNKGWHRKSITFTVNEPGGVINVRVRIQSQDMGGVEHRVARIMLNEGPTEVPWNDESSSSLLFQSGVSAKNKLVASTNANSDQGVTTNSTWDQISTAVGKMYGSGAFIPTNKLRTVYGTPSTEWTDTGQNTVVDVATDKSDSVFIAAATPSGSKTMRKLNDSGVEVWALTNIGYAYGVRTDGVGNSYFAATDGICKISATGIREWNVADVPNGRGVTVDISGNVYAGFYGAAGTKTVRKFNSSGTEIWSNVETAQCVDIDVDAAGNVYCAYNYRVRKLNSAGTLQWDKSDSNLNTSIASDGKIDGYVYITSNLSSAAGKQIRKYTSTGTEIWSLVNAGYTYGSRVRIDKKGNIYFASGTLTTGAKSIGKFDSNGNELWSVVISTLGKSVTPGKDGVVYVAHQGATPGVRKLVENITGYTLL